MIKILQANIVDVNLQTPDKGTALHVFVREKRYDCLMALLIYSNPKRDQYLDVNLHADGIRFSTPLHIAAEVYTI